MIKIFKIAFSFLFFLFLINLCANPSSASGKIFSYQEDDYQYMDTTDYETFEIGPPDNFLHLLPDLSRVNLKDFGLHPGTPVKYVKIDIETGCIEPEIELTFDKSGKLTRYFEGFGGYYTDYVFHYNSLNELTSIYVDSYCSRDDIEDKTRYKINFEIERNDGKIDCIREHAIDDGINLICDNIYKITYNTSGNVKSVTCENNPELFWNEETGYSDPEKNYDDGESKRGVRIWDASIGHYYINDTGKEKLNYLIDPLLNWYELKWEKENYEYSDFGESNSINRTIEYHNDFYGTLRGALDCRITCLDDFYYNNESGIKKITLQALSAEDGTIIEYEFYPDGKVKSKSIHDNLELAIIDISNYYYDENGNIKTVVKRFMDSWIGKEIVNPLNFQDSETIYVAYPVVETQTNFIWQDDRLTDITEKILSVNNRKVNYPKINYSVKQFSNGRISEIVCKDFPELKIKFSPEGFIKQFNAYKCEYSPGSIKKIEYSNIPFRQEELVCDFTDFIHIPDVNLAYSWKFGNIYKTSEPIESYQNHPRKFMWDYHFPPCYDEFVINEEDLRGNWTNLEYEAGFGYPYRIRSEIEYFDR